MSRPTIEQLNAKANKALYRACCALKAAQAGGGMASLFVEDTHFDGTGTLLDPLLLAPGRPISTTTQTALDLKVNLSGNNTLGGNLLFSPDNTYDIGAVGATRPRDLFLGRNAAIGGTLGTTGLLTATGNLYLNAANYPFIQFGGAYTTYLQNAINLAAGGAGTYTSFQLPASRGFAIQRNLVSALTIDPTNANVGIGLDVGLAKLHVQSATEQIRASVDASNYFTITAGASGTTTLKTNGSTNSIVLDNNVNIGSGVANSQLSIVGSGALAGIYSPAYSSSSTNVIAYKDWNGNTRMTLDMSSTTSGKLGLNTAPSAFLHILGTTEQLRLGNTATEYVKFTVSSGGVLTIAPVTASAGAGITFTPAGNGYIGAGGNGFSGNLATVSITNQGTTALTMNLNAADINMQTSANNVKIGSTTNTGGYKLYVNGTLGATGAITNTALASTNSNGRAAITDASGNITAPLLFVPWTGLYAQTGTFFNVGTNAFANPSGPVTGIKVGMDFTTGSTATGACLSTAKSYATALNSGRGDLLPSDFTTLEMEQKIRIPTLSNGTETFIINIGFMASPATANVMGVDGVFAQIIDGTMSLIARAASVNTAGASTFTVVAATTYTVRVIWNPIAATAQMYVDGALITTITTTGLPSTANSVAAYVQMYKTVGTTARTMNFGMGYFKAN